MAYLRGKQSGAGQFPVQFSSSFSGLPWTGIANGPRDTLENQYVGVQLLVSICYSV
jgi:hypothetical protein